MTEKLPPLNSKIENAKRRGDTAYLSNAGRNGAEKTNRIKDIKKTIAELDVEERKLQALEDELARQRAANEDLISPDGEDFGLSEEDRFDKYHIDPRL